MPARRLAARRRAARSSSIRQRVSDSGNSPRGLIMAPPGGCPGVSVRSTLIALALAGAMGGWSCDRGEATPAQRPRDATTAIRQVHLGQTTSSDIEQLFGVADERMADGALIYRFETTRERGGRTQIEAETVTFRFAVGKLAKVCRTRS